MPAGAPSVVAALATQEASQPQVTAAAAHGLGVAAVPLRERLTDNVPWAVKGLLYGVAAFVAVNVLGAMAAVISHR